MSPSGPIPVLEYPSSPDVRWREDGDDLVLTLPTRTSGDAVAEHLGALSASTVFAVTTAAAVWWTTPNQAPLPAQLVLYLFALLGIGQWVLVLMRVLKNGQSFSVPTTIRVTPTMLIVENTRSLAGVTVHGWPRVEIAGLRFDEKNWVSGTRQAMRLQVVTRQNKVTVLTLPWPSTQPLEPHETRLRQAIGLRRRENS